MGDQGTLRFMRTAGGLTHRNALRKKITEIRVTRLVFLDDHKVLTDIPPSSDDWRKGGTKYVDKHGGAHWLASGVSYPVSVTKATRLKLEVDLAVSSADADPVECVITASPSLTTGDSGAPDAFTFQTTKTLGGEPRVKLVLEAKAPLADQVFAALDWRLSWKVEAAGRTFDLGGTGPHRVYITYGFPDAGGRPLDTPYGPAPAPLEDGITEKRMHAAVKLTEEQWRQAIGLLHPKTNEPMDRNDPHVLAMILNARVPSYTLASSPLVPFKHNHPSYMNDQPSPITQEPGSEAGAWPIIDYESQRAECQAIVRLTRGILMQIGCPGLAKLAVVYADPYVEGGATAQVDYVIPRDPAVSKYRCDPNTNQWGLSPGSHRYSRMGWVNDSVVEQRLSLADEKVEEGQRVAPTEDILNAYEACLEFTYGGKTWYHGGGVPMDPFRDAQEVLVTSFWGLVWTSAVKGENDEPRARVDVIVRRYRE